MSLSKRTAFTGFDLMDEEVGQGPYREIAIELKHNFEEMFRDADDANEEMFLDPNFVSALTAFIRLPSLFSLSSLLAVSPVLQPTIVEITRLVSPSLLKSLPVVI